MICLNKNGRAIFTGDTSVEDDFRKFSVDELFDIYDKWLDDLIKQKQGRVYAAVNGGSASNIDMIEINRRESVINRLWALLQSDDRSEYYLLPEKSYLSKEAISQDFNSISAVYIPTEVRLHLYSAVVDTQQLRVVLSDSSDIIKDFVDIRCIGSGVAPVEVMNEDARAYTEQIVYQHNEKYRYFRCRDCGNVVQINRQQDIYMKTQGLQLVQRCSSCRNRKRGTAE